MIKSPLRYPGGKSRSVDLIATIIPEFDEFREPFLGGGSIFIYTKQRFPNKTFWINDLYFDLYSFWKYAQDDITNLVSKIEKLKKNYQDGRELYNYLKNM